MHKTVANASGGTHVELSAEEEAFVRSDWAKNEADQAAKAAAEAAEKALATEALEAVTAGLSEAHKGALKKMFNQE